MSARILSCAALSVALVAAPTTAQEARRVDLAEALSLFGENNLELRVARLRADQAAGLARQASAFPNPTLSATHEQLSGASRSYSETYLTASQRLEISGARGARADAAEYRADAAAFAYRADSLRLAFEVKKAYTEAVLAQERGAVGLRATEVFRAASARARERYDDGDISRFTLGRIDVERTRYERILADAEIQVAAAQRRLSLLVAPSDWGQGLAAAGLPSPTPPVPPGRTGFGTVARRPELDASRLEVDAEEAQARLIRAERVPDLTATGGFKRQSDGLHGAFLGLSLPVPVFDRGGGAIEAADAGLRAAEERLQLTRRLVESDVSRAEEAYRALAARAALFLGAGNEDPQDLLDIALVAFEEGEMELLELLDAAEAAHGASTDRASMQADLWIAYFDLERALGGFVEPTEEDTP